MGPIQAHEELVVLAAVLVARANPRTLRSGSANDRIMVDVSVLRRMAATLEVASPGAVAAVRERLGQQQVRTRRRRQCRGCGRAGGELTENGCPSCGPDASIR